MEVIIKQYLYDLFHAIPIFIFVVLFIVLFIFSAIIYFSSRIKMKWRMLIIALLLEYLFLIYCSTIIFRPICINMKSQFRPFWSYTAIQAGERILLPENIMNVVIFIPIGFLMGLVSSNVRWLQIILIGSGLSFSIELLQTFFQRGFFDIDDIIHNVLGCIIGYGVLSLVKFSRRRQV